MKAAPHRRPLRVALPLFGLPVLALVLAPLGAVAPAYAVPGTVSITNPSGLSEASTDAEFPFTTYVADWGSDAGGHVVIEVNHPDGSTDSCQTDTLSSTAESWDCTAILELGTNEIEAYAVGSPSDEIGPSTGVTLLLGETGYPDITSPTDGDTLDAGWVFITGNGPALAEITLTQDGYQDYYCTDTIDVDGEWDCYAYLDQAEDVELVAIATDVLGTVTTSPPVTVDVQLLDADTEITIPGAAAVQIIAEGTPGNYVHVWPELANTPDDPGGYDFASTEDQDCYEDESSTASGIEALEDTDWNSERVDCLLEDIPAGIWEFQVNHFHYQGEGGQQADGYYYVYVPMAPTLDAETDGETVTLTGTGEPGMAALVYRNGGDDPVCTATIGGSGRFSCTDEPGNSGSYAYAAAVQSIDFEIDTERLDESAAADYAASFDGISDYSFPAGPVAVVLPQSGGPNTPATKPAAPLAETGFTWTFHVLGPDGLPVDDLRELFPGDAITVVGEGVPEGSNVTAELHSDPVLLGQSTGAVDGSFSIASVIPSDTPAGGHEVVVTVDDGVSSEPVALAINVNVAEAVLVEPTPSPGTSPGGVDSGGGLGIGPGAELEPNALTQGVATLGQLLSKPLNLLLGVLLALLLLFLVAIPSELLTSTLDKNSNAFGRFSRWGEGVKERIFAVPGVKAVLAVLVAIAASIIYGFADPEFGFDLASLRMVLANAIAFVVLYFVLNFVVGRIVDGAWKVPTTIDVKPSMLVIAVFGIALSRLVGFSPGVFIGLAIGLVLLREHEKAELGATLLRFGAIFAVSVGAWLAYSAIAGTWTSTDFGVALLHETLVATAVEGLTSLGVAILPLAFLEGRNLWEASKGMWAGAFLLITSAFALIVLPTGLDATQPEHIGFWYLVLIAYATVAFGTWGYFVRRGRREARNTTQHDVSRR